MSTLVLPYQLQNTAIFVVFLLIIFLRPQGMFGRVCGAHLMRGGERQGNTSAIGAFAAAYLLLALPRPQRLLPAHHDLVLLWATVVARLEHAERLQRHFSFGHAVFWGLGAYTVTIAVVIST